MRLSLFSTEMLILSALVFAGVPASAQSRISNGDLSVARTEVALVTVDKPPYGDEDVVVIRRVNAIPHDVIAIRRGAERQAQLANAIKYLLMLRSRDGDVPSKNIVVRVPMPESIQRHHDEAAMWIGWLRQERRRNIEGMGNLPTVTLLLRSQHPH
jgi:hypothetical protein